MTNLISRAIASITSLLTEFQAKRLFAAVLVGFLLLTTNANPGYKNDSLTEQVRDRVHQNDSERPKTTGEWLKEAREDAPLDQRLGEIGKQSASAVKDFGKVYPDTAKRSGRDARDSD